jgi:Glycosyl hydrolases family 31
MKNALIVTLLLAGATHAGSVVSRDWAGGKLTLKLDDGSAQIEWISPVAFRVSRTWGAAPDALPEISHEAISPTLEDAGQTISMRTRYLTVDVDRGDMALHVKSGEMPVSTMRIVDGAEVRLSFLQNERVFGLMADVPKLNLRGEKLIRDRGFFLTSAGYGISTRFPTKWSFDLAEGVLSAPGAKTIEYLFYYGPTSKEILEQHATAMGSVEVKSNSLDLLSPGQLPKAATILKSAPNASNADALLRLIRSLNSWSLSGVVYPAVDVGDFDYLRGDARQRLTDLCSLLPIVFRSSGEGGIDAATRLKWRPYLITYLREAYDRGYPLIRPLPMQFSKDTNSDKQSDVFMLGDEVLLAPASGPKRALDLPRGTWTDVRTNTEYRGGQAIEVAAPVGQVPMFVRNGWIVPFEMPTKMELHYYPSLGGEFFLWEPDQGENSQFHAAPAGDYMRVEVETKVTRTYEWVIHHTKAPKEVGEESGAYFRVARKDLLKAGTWWHDAAANNLHLMLRAEAGADRIVNMSF